MGVYTVNQTDGSLVRVAGGTLYADAPIGAIQSYGGEIAPAGWLICDGSTLSRTDYAELFAVIGINFNEGDGETTFGIPDLRECVPVGAEKNITKSIATHDRYNLGQFKDDQVQEHTHTFTTVGSGSGMLASGGSYNLVVTETTSSNSGRSGTTTHGKQLGVNYIIKAKQVALPTDFMDALAKYNELSDFELMSASGTIQYDGFIYVLTSTSKAAFRVELTRNETTLRLDGSYAGGGYGTSNCIPVKKGDIYTSTDADIYGSFYKNR